MQNFKSAPGKAPLAPLAVSCGLAGNTPKGTPASPGAAYTLNALFAGAPWGVAAAAVAAGGQ